MEFFTTLNDIHTLLGVAIETRDMELLVHIQSLVEKYIEEQHRISNQSKARWAGVKMYLQSAKESAGGGE